MTDTRNECRIARRAVNQGARPANLAGYAVEKPTTLPNARDSLLKCQTKTQISTFNTRTLTAIHQFGELAACAERHQQDIICIQEHRFHHDDVNLKHHNMGKGYILVTSSATKNSTNATIGGVGILLSSKAAKSLNNIETISSRIMIATFNGNPQTTVICCYSPTNTAEEEEVEDFYGELTSLVRQVPKHNVLIIGGDFNAKVGKEEGFSFAYHTTTNRNGYYLTDLLNENNLTCLNTRFQKSQSKTWTFTYPNEHKAQLD